MKRHAISRNGFAHNFGRRTWQGLEEAAQMISSGLLSKVQIENLLKAEVSRQKVALLNRVIVIVAKGDYADVDELVAQISHLKDH